MLSSCVHVETRQLGLYISTQNMHSQQCIKSLLNSSRMIYLHRSLMLDTHDRHMDCFFMPEMVGYGFRNRMLPAMDKGRQTTWGNLRRALIKVEPRINKASKPIMDQYHQSLVFHISHGDSNAYRKDVLHNHYLHYHQHQPPSCPHLLLLAI